MRQPPERRDPLDPQHEVAHRAHIVRKILHLLGERHVLRPYRQKKEQQYPARKMPALQRRKLRKIRQPQTTFSICITAQASTIGAITIAAGIIFRIVLIISSVC